MWERQTENLLLPIRVWRVAEMVMLIFKKRFFRLETLGVILISVILMCISVATGAWTDIVEYLAYRDGSSIFFDGYPLLYSEETMERILASKSELQLSQWFSFYAVMYHGFHVYLLPAHLLIAVPFLRFFDERKNGYTRLLAVRGGNLWYIQEAVADSLVVGCYVLLPLLIFWGISAIVCPMLYPLNQDFVSSYDEFFVYGKSANDIILVYLILILLTSIQFFLRGFFLFILAVFVEKKVVLLFSSLIYTYGFEVLCILLQKYDYGTHFYLMENLKSLSPFLVNCFVNLLITVILFAICFRKDKILND